MTEHQRPRIGMVGLGRMGTPLCGRLLSAGYPVQLYARTPSRVAALVDDGASMAKSLAELASSNAIVLTCLDTVEACEEVVLDPAGLVANARAGTLLIELSTIAPSLARHVHRAAQQRQVEYADAPVSGGPEGARNGTLAIMVGASDAAFARAEPLLRHFGTTVVHMGEARRGSETKLVNQLLTFVHGAAAAEAIALADHAGLDPERLETVLAAGFGQSRMLERTLARARRGDFDAGAALALYAKDLGLLHAMAGGVGLQLAVADTGRAILQRAIDEGLGARDIAALRLRYPPRPVAPLE